MRNDTQQKKFNKLISVLDEETDLHDLMNKTYVKYLQNKLVADFEEVVGVNTFYNKLNLTDEEVYLEYTTHFYNFNLYIEYFQHKQNYEACSVIKRILDVSRDLHLKLIISNIKEAREGWEAVLDIAEDEIKQIIKNEYGSQF